MLKMKMLALVSVIALAVPSAADATEFNFSYNTLSGTAVSGVLSATDLGGFYSVDNVTGTRGGATITGYDFFDDSAQMFNYSNGYVSNVDFSYYVVDENYEIRFPGNGFFGTEFLNGSSSLLVTAFSLSPALAPTSAVPEPAIWSMMILGMALVGGVMRRRQKFSTRVTFG